MRSYSSEQWENTFSSRVWGAYPCEDLIRFIARHFYSSVDRSTIRILETGCGPGSNLWYLIREGFCVAGIDGSAAAIHQLKARLIAEGLPDKAPLVELEIGNFKCLPWRDNVFNAVIDVEALYANRIADIHTTVAEIKRVLKLDGVFFGKMFGVETTGSDSGEMIEPQTRHCPTVGPCAGNHLAHFFTHKELVEIFSSFSKVVIDQTCRTDHDNTVRIFEWLVSASC